MSAHDQDHLAPIKVEPAPAAGRKIVIHQMQTALKEADTMSTRPTTQPPPPQTDEAELARLITTTPAKRGRRPGTPNPNGGRHPGTQAKTRVDLTAEAAELLATFAARVNETRGQATRQDEIASAIIVRYLGANTASAPAKYIAAMIDEATAQEAGTP